jgi:hypothetical protein
MWSVQFLVGRIIEIAVANSLSAPLTGQVAGDRSPIHSAQV